MPDLQYSNRFADDLARVTSTGLEQRIVDDLDNIEAFGEYGSKNVPESIRLLFGEGVRKVALNPFDLIYTLDNEANIAFIEALIPQREARWPSSLAALV